MITVKHIRLEDDGMQTLGQWFVFDGLDKIFECKILELPYKDNKRNISCIPKGTYKVEKTYSPSFKKSLYLVKDVSNRSGIRIHVANFNYQLRGCLAPGQSFYDINKDGLKDVTSSGNTLKHLHAILPNEFELEII